MSADKVRIEKIEIYGDHLILLFMSEPMRYDLIHLQYFLQKKNLAKITFVKDKKQCEENLKRIETNYFVTETDTIYAYR